tara:strand:- start:2788 stop:3162 length:375 start_codon:yes stop_codon:yes gene_type:complete
METKKCKYCRKEKPVDDFEVANTVGGKVYRRLKCKQCYFDVKRNYVSKKRQWLDSYKKTQKCRSCGNDDFRVLEFHHKIKNKKEHSVSNMVKTCGIDKIKQEIKKCDILCANCHRILHWKENRV